MTIILSSFDNYVPTKVQEFMRQYRVVDIRTEDTDIESLNFNGRTASMYAGSANINVKMSSGGFQRLVDDADKYDELAEMILLYPDLRETFEKYLTMYRLSVK